jgi:hypothetical protein
MSIKITKTIAVVVLLAVALAFSVMAASSYNWVRPANPADILNYYINATNTTIEEIIWSVVDVFFFLDYDKTIKINDTLAENINITGNLSIGGDIEGNISCEYITGTSSNLCTITGSGGAYDNYINETGDILGGNLTLTSDAKITDQDSETNIGFENKVVVIQDSIVGGLLIIGPPP